MACGSSGGCSGCSSASSCGSAQQTPPDLTAKLNESLVTSLLAITMARRGFKVGILDGDITGPSIPKVFGINGKAHVDELGMYPIQSKGGIDVMSVNLLLENESDPVLWRGPIVGNVVKQFYTDVIWKDLDYLFVDMPPGTGDVAITVFQSLSLDGIGIYDC